MSGLLTEYRASGCKGRICSEKRAPGNDLFLPLPRSVDPESLTGVGGRLDREQSVNRLRPGLVRSSSFRLSRQVAPHPGIQTVPRVVDSRSRGEEVSTAVRNAALATMTRRRSMGRRSPNDCRYGVPATALSPPEPSPGGGGQPDPVPPPPAFACVRGLRMPRLPRTCESADGAHPCSKCPQRSAAGPRTSAVDSSQEGAAPRRVFARRDSNPRLPQGVPASPEQIEGDGGGKRPLLGSR